MHTRPYLPMASCKRSSATSSVASCPAISASTRAWLRSYPTVGYFVENSLASGRPTYPSPITAILMSFISSILVLISFLDSFPCSSPLPPVLHSSTSLLIPSSAPGLSYLCLRSFTHPLHCSSPPLLPVSPISATGPSPLLRPAPAGFLLFCLRSHSLLLLAAISRGPDGLISALPAIASPLLGLWLSTTRKGGKIPPFYNYTKILNIL